jgi:protein-tyrosine phosphatase
VKKILFVCLGNICRSPLAEGIFLHLLKERGLARGYSVDSAGTGGWHVGEPPDERALAAAARRGVPLACTGRQVHPKDFRDFDHILAMDKTNRDALLALCPPAERSKVRLMRDYDPHAPGADVPDPYYGDAGGFDAVFDMLHRSCGRLIDELEGGNGGRRG